MPGDWVCVLVCKVLLGALVAYITWDTMYMKYVVSNVGASFAREVRPYDPVRMEWMHTLARPEHLYTPYICTYPPRLTLVK